MIADRQVRLMRQKRMEGKTQETAAAKAGMSVRSAQVAERPIASQAKPGHRRTDFLTETMDPPYRTARIFTLTRRLGPRHGHRPFV